MITFIKFFNAGSENSVKADKIPLLSLKKLVIILYVWKRKPIK